MAKSTIIIPPLGYLILFNAKVVDFLKLHAAFCQGAGCGISWRLYFLYFGCCAMALGAGLFGVFCPPLIKKYAGAPEFFEADKTYYAQPANLEYLFRLIEEVKGKPADDPLQLRANLISQQAGLNADHVNMLAGPMGEHYVLRNYVRPNIRILIFLAYCVGILLLLIPTMYTFFQVLWIAMRSMWVA